MHVHGPAERTALVAPDGAQQPVAAQHLPTILDEVLEQPQFPRRQLDQFAGLSRLAAYEVDFHVTEFTGARDSRLAARAAQDGLDPCHQFHETERLRHVVVGAGAQAQHLVDLLAAGGEHDDR